ncbi:glycosyltransferase [Halosolutus halophilus]|uniref:glycosyltransferase n=1 Tax=Halosolutus halophilus TaxID=1552990 RepID=UPI002234F409|nr:glycosyltransferase [Halosolutus halophilus]
MSRTVGLVVPAFRPNVDALRAYVRELDRRLDLETIRVELDDPTASTRDRLEGLPASVNAVDERRGKGGAITAGFCALETDVRAFVDADGSTAVDSVGAIVDRVRGGRTDLAVGSRRHPDADVVTRQSARRRLLGDAFAWLACRLLAVSVTDYQCGAKAIDAAAWADVSDRLRERGFAWDVELLALVDALDYRISEVPVTWADDPESTVSSIWATRDLATGLCRARHRAKHLRGDRFHTAIANRRSDAQTVIEALERRRTRSPRDRTHDDE